MKTAKRVLATQWTEWRSWYASKRLLTCSRAIMWWFTCVRGYRVTQARHVPRRGPWGGIRYESRWLLVRGDAPHYGGVRALRHAWPHPGVMGESSRLAA